jgi:hypothetical protein
MALMEAGAGDGEKREAFRAAFRASISLILLRAFPGCGQPKAQAMTAVVLHIVKGLATVTPEKLADAPLLPQNFEICYASISARAWQGRPAYEGKGNEGRTAIPP